MISLLFFYYSLFQMGYGQDQTEGYWLPLKRLEQIDKLKNDRCDSSVAFPFKKIKFLSNRTVSLFGFRAADPSVCRISLQNEGTSWKVEDSILHTLYPELVIGSKIILRLEKDTLHTYLTKNGVTFHQKFIRKYGGVNFIDYRETEVGNVFIKGTYLFKGNSDMIVFKDNGKMIIHSSNGLFGLNFETYRFKFYAAGSCENIENEARGIIEMSDKKGTKTQFFIKDGKRAIEFYKILKMNNWWTDASIEKVFSLSKIK